MPQPSRPDRRTALRARNRQLVVSTAQRLFAERGFASTSVALIADEADLAVSTVFSHFAHKEELFFDGRCPWSQISDDLAGHPDRWTTAPELIDAVSDVVVTHLHQLQQAGPHRGLEDLMADPVLTLWESGARRRAGRSISAHIARHAPGAIGVEAERCAALTLAEAGTVVDQHRRMLLTQASPSAHALPGPVRPVLIGRLAQLHDLVVGQVAGPLGSR